MVMANPILPIERDLNLASNARPLPAGIADQDSWRDGIRFQGNWEQARPSGFSSECADQDDPITTTAPARPEVWFKPFTAHIVGGCDALTPQLGEQQTAYLSAAFDAAASYPLEQQFWSGAYDQTIPHLQSTADVVGSAATPTRAIIELLSARRSTSETVLIHGPASMVPALQAADLVERRNGGLFGFDGWRYVPGPGYPQFGGANSGPWGTNLAFPDGFAQVGQGVGVGTKGTPSDESASQCWFYITGAVEYAYGPVFGNLEGAKVPFDRNTFWSHRTNEWLIMPQRQMIYRFDPFDIYATLVTVPS